MAEISKLFKMMLIIDVIIAFIYGILYVFLPDIVYFLNDAPYYDPQFWRLFGGTVLAIGIGTVLSLLMNEWEKIKLFILVMLIFLIIIGIINITSLLYTTRSIINIGFYWLDTILIIVLAILNGFLYIREDKKGV